MTIPEPPQDRRNPSAWIWWVDRNFAFAPDWQQWLIRRDASERPEFGTLDSLNDLKGIEDRGHAAMLAWLWFSMRDNQDRILGHHKGERDNRIALERQRLVKLACQALDGKLGGSNEERDAARECAHSLLGPNPDRCSDHDLSDWSKMHQHQKELRRNPNAKKPRLWADVRREREQRAQLNDIDQGIGSVPAAKPRMQREMFG